MGRKKGIMETVSLETVPETSATLHHHIDPTKDDSPPDENMNGSSIKKSKRRKKKKKKKEEALCGEEKTLDVSENPCQQAQDSCEKPEDSESGAVDMTSSEKKKKRRKKKNDNDRDAPKESGVDTNSEVTMECDARHKSKAQGSKVKSEKEKKVDGTVVHGCLKSKDDTEDQLECADAETDETVSQTPKAKKKKRKTKTVEVCDALEDTLGTSMESEPVECMETGGVCEVKSKKRKRKKKKTEETDQETADMEVYDPSENTLLATIDSGSVECLLDHSNKEVLEKCGKNGGEDENGEPKQKKSKKKKKKKKKKSCELSEEVNEPKQKKKKKKTSCEDDKCDNIDVEKDDVSVPRSEGELEFDEEKLETQLSSSVLTSDNMAQGVATQDTGDLPRCSCNGQSKRKLVVFDLNGILADIARGNTGECVPDGKISFRSVFKRPFVTPFLDFCFEKFDVGIWSSRRIGLDYMTDIVMGNHAKNLLFSFDQSICITTNFKTLENTTKPLFLKDLRTVWNRFGTCLSCGKRKYDETNTLLVDDSPDKALCNPPYTGIFPFPYQYTDREDSALGPDGELRKYMERLVDAENVQKFVEENPIGQSAITETHQSWSFYSRVIKAHKQ